MALTNRQKNIPNFVIVSEQAPNYSFTDKRNKQVQEAIHTGFMACGQFPKEGDPLAPVGDLNGEANNRLVITIADLEAYAACYPQNAFIDEIDGKAVLVPDPNFDVLALYISTRFNPVLTVTTPEAQRPKNQGTIYESLPTGSARVSQIPAIPMSYTDQRVSLLLETIGFETGFASKYPIVNQDFYASVVQENPAAGIYTDSPPEDLNFWDWTANVSPVQSLANLADAFMGKTSEKIYYNPDKKAYYNATRTNVYDPKTFDLGEDQYTANGINNNNIIALKAGYLDGILQKFGVKTSGFNSSNYITEWQRTNNQELGELVTVYGDLTRPNPPAETTVWSICFILPEEIFNQIANIDPTAHLGARASIPHPVVIQKLIAEGIGGGETLTGNKSFRAPFTLKELESNVSDTIEVLKYYKNEMSNEGVKRSHFTPIHFDIELEIENLENFLGEPLQRIISLTSMDGKGKEDDAIEFVLDEEFKIHWVSYNGNIVLKDPNSIASRLSPTKFIQKTYVDLQNSDPNISPRTMCYVWNSKQISKIKGVAADKRPPWTVFISSTTLGNPKYDPSKNQARNLKDKGQTTDSPFLSPEFVEAAVKASTNFGLDSLRQIPSAAGACDTTLSKIVKETYAFGSMFSAYFYGNKIDWKSIITRAVFLARSELIELENVKKIIESPEYRQAAAVAGAPELAAFEALTNPAAVGRQIEMYVDREISCALDIVGDSLQSQLNAMGAAPAVGQLAHNALDTMPPIRLAFKKQGNKGFFTLWGEAILEMATDFVRQMLLSVVKDMLQAAICPPPDDDDTPIDIQMSTYGILQVNDLVGTKGDIDLVEVADEVGIKFKFYKTEGDEKKVAMREPTLEELKQFNNDASDILMRKEMLSLLQGNPFPNTPERILEIVKRIRPSQLEGLSEENKNDPIEVDLLGDSRSERDTRYAALNLDAEKINNYFSRIGFLLGNLENIIDPLPPEIAYCDKRNPQPPGYGSGIDMGISQAQLQRQINAQLQSKYDKIFSLCDFASGFGTLQINLNSFMSAFEEPQWYKDFLKAISAASAAAFGAAAQAQGMENAYPQVSETTYTMEETKMWDAVSPIYGQRLMKPKIKPFHGGVKWYIGDSRLGYITVTFKRNQGTSQATATYDYHIPRRDPRVVVASVPTAGTNRTSRYRRGANRWTLIPEGSSLHAAPTIEKNSTGAGAFTLNKFSFRADMLERNSNRFQDIYGGPFTQAWANKINSNLDLAKNQAFGPRVGTGDHSNVNHFTTDQNLNPDGRWIRVMAGEYYDIKRSLINFYQMPVGIRRYKKFATVIAAPAFVPTENPCITTDEERIAAAALDCVQQRIVNFMLNVGYLLPVYAGWVTPDIFNSVAAYLSKKIELDMREEGVYELFVSSLELIEKTMSRPLGTSFVDFDFENLEPRVNKFDYVVKQVYRTILERIGRQTEYQSAATNLVENPTWVDAMMQVVGYFKTGWFRLAGTNDDNIGEFPDNRTSGYTAGANSRELSVDSLNLVPDFFPGGHAPNPNASPDDRRIDDNLSYWHQNNWTAYLPILHIIAMQIMYADKIVNINDKYPKFKFYSGRRVSNADDALRSALNPEYIAIYNPAYSVFPVTFNNVQFYTENQLRNQLSALERLRNYMQTAESEKTLIRTILAGLRSEINRGIALDGWANWNFINVYLQQAEASLSAPNQLTGENLRSSDWQNRMDNNRQGGWPRAANDLALGPEFDITVHKTVKDYLAAMYKKSHNQVLRDPDLQSDFDADQAWFIEDLDDAIGQGKLWAKTENINASEAESAIIDTIHNGLTGLTKNTTPAATTWWPMLDAYADIVRTFGDNNSVIPPTVETDKTTSNPRSSRGETTVLRVGDMYFEFNSPTSSVSLGTINSLVSQITSFLGDL